MRVRVWVRVRVSLRVRVKVRVRVRVRVRVSYAHSSMGTALRPSLPKSRQGSCGWRSFTPSFSANHSRTVHVRPVASSVKVISSGGLPSPLMGRDGALIAFELGAASSGRSLARASLAVRPWRVNATSFSCSAFHCAHEP